MTDLERVRDSYIKLLIKSLLNEIYPDSEQGQVSGTNGLKIFIKNVIEKFGYKLVRPVTKDQRQNGTFWPMYAHTMVGQERLKNLRTCLEDVIQKSIPGDFIETGVWRGGSCILAKGIFNAYGEKRKVFVADSFAGLPEGTVGVDSKSAVGNLYKVDLLAISVDEVKANFNTYSLLDDSVIFLKGWFKDTLPTISQDQRFAVVRLDGDMYESTRDAIVALYPKLSNGGYLIVDDYHDIEACKTAIDEYRQQNNIIEPVMNIDTNGVYWQKV